MTVGIMTAAASWQHRILPSYLQVSSPSALSSALFSASQNLNLRIVSPSLHVCVVSTSRRRFPAESQIGRTPGVVAEEEEDEDEDEDEEEDGDALSLYEEELGQEDEEDKQNPIANPVANPNGVTVRRTFRSLGNKEKKELRAYAHQLGSDICVHQVGKWGLTANCITAISDALEANELVKIRVLDNLDEELNDTATQLENKTGGQVVGKMGRTLLLYRPSMRKLKAAQAAELKAFQYQKRKNVLASRAKSSRSFLGAPRGKR